MSATRFISCPVNRSTISHNYMLCACVETNIARLFWFNRIDIHDQDHYLFGYLGLLEIYYIIGILSDRRLFRFANISWHLSRYHFISRVIVYLGLPGYHDITPYHASPFISIRQNITASNSYRRATHGYFFIRT